MFQVDGKLFVCKIPMEFFPDIDKFSEQEIRLLSPFVSEPSKTQIIHKKSKLTFEILIKIHPTYSLYHSKYADVLHHFGNMRQEAHHRQLAYHYNPTNSQFINEFIKYLKEANSNTMPIPIKHQILVLYSQLFERFESYQNVLSNDTSSPDDPNAFSENSEFGFGYLSEFPYLSFLRAVHTYSFFIKFNVISLNKFMADCYDEYYSFQCLFNHQSCNFNKIFNYAEKSVVLAPNDWNKMFGLASMYCLKGRYKKSLYHIKKILSAFQKNQNEIIKSLHPMRMSQLHLIHLKTLIKFEYFEMAMEVLQLNDKHIDQEENVWCSALKIELFAHLSIYYPSKSSIYIQKAFVVYENNKQLAMFDKDYKDTFLTSYAFLLITSRKVQTANDLLEKLRMVSTNEGGWIEYLLGYIQQHKFKHYQHAKCHYFASFKHNNQIPEVRYNLALLMMHLKEYKMSYLQLKKAMNMHSGLPMIGRFGDDLLKKLRKELKRLKCANCARCYYPKCKNAKKLSVCKGCGKYYYCNRKCQKRHWNAKHRMLCDNSYFICSAISTTM